PTEMVSTTAFVAGSILQKLPSPSFRIHLRPSGPRTPSGVIVATTKVGTSPSDGVRGPDGLKWIRNDGEGSFWRIDPATNAVVDTISVGPHQFVVRSAFGDIWVGEFQGHRIW